MQTAAKQQTEVDPLPENKKQRFSRYTLIDRETGEPLSTYLRGDGVTEPAAGSPCVYVGAAERNAAIETLVRAGVDKSRIESQRVREVPFQDAA